VSSPNYNINDWGGENANPPQQWYPYLCNAIPGYAVYRPPPSWTDTSDNKDLSLGFLTIRSGTKQENPYKGWAAQYRPGEPLAVVDEGLGSLRVHSFDTAAESLMNDFSPRGGWYPGIVLDEKGYQVKEAKKEEKK
jgi:hypothetical protein